MTRWPTLLLGGFKRDASGRECAACAPHICSESRHTALVNGIKVEQDALGRQGASPATGGMRVICSPPPSDPGPCRTGRAPGRLLSTPSHLPGTPELLAAPPISLPARGLVPQSWPHQLASLIGWSRIRAPSFPMSYSTICQPFTSVHAVLAHCRVVPVYPLANSVVANSPFLPAAVASMVAGRCAHARAAPATQAGHYQTCFCR